MKRVKCNKCGYVGDESEFPKGRDFFQNSYIAGCANLECDNRQNPADASMRMMPGVKHPFEFIRPKPSIDDPLATVLHQTKEAS